MKNDRNPTNQTRVAAHMHWRRSVRRHAQRFMMWARRCAHRNAKHEIALKRAIGSFGSPKTIEDFMRSPAARSAGSFDTTRYRVLTFVSAIDGPRSTTWRPYSSAAASEQMTAIPSARLTLRSMAHSAEFSAGSHAKASPPRSRRRALSVSRNVPHCRKISGLLYTW
eukprot:SAG31_NODE_1489_length_8135_cov_3.382558_9_plen_167_part_00